MSLSHVLPRKRLETGDGKQRDTNIHARRGCTPRTQKVHLIAAYCSPSILIEDGKRFNVQNLPCVQKVEPYVFSRLFMEQSQPSTSLSCASIKDVSTALRTSSESNNKALTRSVLHLSGHCSSGLAQDYWLMNKDIGSSIMKLESAECLFSADCGRKVFAQEMAETICRYSISNLWVVLSGCNTKSFGKNIQNIWRSLDKRAPPPILVTNRKVEDQAAFWFVYHVYVHLLRWQKKGSKDNNNLAFVAAVKYAKTQVAYKLSSAFEVLI